MKLLLNDNKYALSKKLKYIIREVVKMASSEMCLPKSMNSKLEVSILITDNQEIQYLNKKFRGIDKSTDVLSFPFLDFNSSDKNIFRQKKVLLGDIVVNIDKVFSQAKEYGHSIERELGFLCVHGVLHLYGYDHINSKERQIMFNKQEKILKKAKLVK